MSHPSEANEKFKVKFKWGIKKGVGRINNDIHFYDSFTFEDVEYLLYDCAYFYRTGDAETSIGKIVKIYETPTHEKKVKVVWLFRPIELREYLGDYEPRWNELLLATGEGTTISNLNPLEAVVRKCNVVCTSNDQRNPQPSEAELRKADYIFCSTFDVGNNTISQNFADKIDGVKVAHYFNREKDQQLINLPNLEANIKERAGKSSSSSKVGSDKKVGNAVKDGMFGIKVSPVVKESKNATISVGEQRNFPNENSTLRPKVPIDKDETRPNIISFKERAGKSGFSSKLGLDKAVGSAVKDGMSSNKVSPVVKESKNAAISVGERRSFSNENSTLRPKVPVDKDETRPNKISFKERVGKSGFSSKLGLDRAFGSAVKDGMSGSKVSPVVKESKNAAISVGDEQRSFPNENTTLRPEVLVDKDQTRTNIISFKEQVGKSGFSSKLGLDKAVGSAIKDGMSSIKVSPVVKESKNTVVTVGEQRNFPNKNTKLRPKVHKDETRHSGKSSFSSKLGLEKAVGSAVKDGMLDMSNSKVSPVVKESENAAVSVGKQRHFPNENTTLRAKVSDDKNETRPNIISCNRTEEHAKRVRLSGDLLPMRDTITIRPPKKRMFILDEKETKISDKRARQSPQDSHSGTKRKC